MKNHKLKTGPLNLKTVNIPRLIKINWNTSKSGPLYKTIYILNGSQEI